MEEGAFSVMSYRKLEFHPGGNISKMFAGMRVSFKSVAQFVIKKRNDF